MNRFALLADIHGNIWALDAVLADIDRRRIETIYDLGDSLCSPLAPADTADRLIQRGIPSLMGNEDRILIEPLNATHNVRFTRQQLRPEHLAWIAALPKTRQPAEGILLCHGTPDSDSRYLMEEVLAAGVQVRDTPSLRLMLLARPEALIACGHSHLPRILWRDAGRILINPGSVGLQAYSADEPFPHLMEAGSPHARYAVVTRRARGWQIELVALPYDYGAASRCAAENGRPDWAARLLTGRV